MFATGACGKLAGCRPLWLAVLTLAMAAMGSGAMAQWASNRGYQLLQRVDDVLFGIDSLALRILDRHHVAGTLQRINAQRPLPLLGQVDFVVDCRAPMRLAIVPPGRAAPPPLQELEFADVALLDGTWASAEFACESTRQPARAAQLARAIFERGGPLDMQTLYCDLQPDGSAEVRHGVEVRFSPGANAVAVNRQWLSSGSVSEDEVRFGANSQWRINRAALDIRRSARDGEMLFSGQCDRRPPALGTLSGRPQPP